MKKEKNILAQHSRHEDTDSDVEVKDTNNFSAWLMRIPGFCSMSEANMSTIFDRFYIRLMSARFVAVTKKEAISDLVSSSKVAGFHDLSNDSKQEIHNLINVVVLNEWREGAEKRGILD